MLSRRILTDVKFIRSTESSKRPDTSHLPSRETGCLLQTWVHHRYTVTANTHFLLRLHTLDLIVPVSVMLVSDVSSDAPFSFNAQDRSGRPEPSHTHGHHRSRTRSDRKSESVISIYIVFSSLCREPPRLLDAQQSVQ